MMIEPLYDFSLTAEQGSGSFFSLVTCPRISVVGTFFPFFCMTKYSSRSLQMKGVPFRTVPMASSSVFCRMEAVTR